MAGLAVQIFVLSLEREVGILLVAKGDEAPIQIVVTINTGLP